MIVALGIDAVEIERFAHWHTKSLKELSTLFSPAEIQYALDVPLKSAERFAVRFAAKEALYKALSHLCSNHTLHLRSVCRATEICHAANGVPFFHIEWERIACGITPVTPQLSLTHTKTTALAVALICYTEL
jgi:phosphopantetheine--protein transferase-like protein